MKSHGIERRNRHERRPTIQHPSLADREWLTEQYATSTATTIAASIGADLTTVRRALRIHGITPHTPSETRRLLRPWQLDDADWLRRAYQTRSIASIAQQLDVADAAVQTAMMRVGVERRARGKTQALRRPLCPLHLAPKRVAAARLAGLIPRTDPGRPTAGTNRPQEPG